MVQTPAPNPYSTPESSLQQEPPAPLRLASRWQRVGGWFADLLLGYVVALPLLLTLDLARLVEIGRDQSKMLSLYVDSLAGQVTAAATLALLTLNWYLIATRGQSLGKLVVGTRIERTNGSPAGFLHGVVLRQWVLLIPTQLALVALYIGANQALVTFVSGLLSWAVGISYLLIFGSERRCGHDYIAGTRVVRNA